jgi:hypothetical protein
LLYRGVHPVAVVLGEKRGKLMVEEDYFDRKPDYYQFDATPAGRKYGVNVDKPTVNFRHTLSDIVNAIYEAGFILERLVETKAEREGFPQLSRLPYELAVVARSKSLHSRT